VSIAVFQRSQKPRGIKPTQPPVVPRLLNGDHVSLPVFERRHAAMPNGGKAELIEGIVMMSPPIRSEHGKAHCLLASLLWQYAAATPGVACAVNSSLRLDGCNEYQPDVLLWIERENPAQAKTGPDGILEGRPELVVEIALNSNTFELHEKKSVYQRNRIPEYIVWEMVDEPRFHWFTLENGEYVSTVHRKLHGLVLCSYVFPGLWLDWPSLMVGRGFDKGVFRTLDRGLKSAEHRAFVKKLAKS
jgi:Uma2 family endonuclease